MKQAQFYDTFLRVRSGLTDDLEPHESERRAQARNSLSGVWGSSQSSRDQKPRKCPDVSAECLLAPVLDDLEVPSNMAQRVLRICKRRSCSRVLGRLVRPHTHLG